MIVTVFVASLENPHFAAAMQGALDAFDGSRYHLMFAQTGHSEQLSPDVIETMLPFRPAAVMFTGVIRREDTREALRRLGVPVVEMWGDDHEPIDMLVGESGYAGGRLMGLHFGEQGFRRIAFAGYVGERGNARLEGFRDGLRSLGRDVDLVVPSEGTSTFSGGVAAFEQIMTRLPECDAAFMGSDLLAAGAVVAARRIGVEIPGRTAVAGYGDLDFSAQILPALTTIHVGDYDIGRRAGEMLRARLEGVAVESRKVHMPLELVVRTSTMQRGTPD
jgi:LacI family gluconate utilization system Gnt-I transcriptional repressor